MDGKPNMKERRKQEPTMVADGKEAACAAAAKAARQVVRRKETQGPQEECACGSSGVRTDLEGKRQQDGKMHNQKHLRS